MANQSLHVRIISPQELILDTQADSVSSKNVDGPFDILVQHANFITMVENSPIVVKKKGQPPQTFNFPLAIIMATRDIVNIYTHIQAQTVKK